MLTTPSPPFFTVIVGGKGQGVYIQSVYKKRKMVQAEEKKILDMNFAIKKVYLLPCQSGMITLYVAFKII